MRYSHSTAPDGTRACWIQLGYTHRCQRRVGCSRCSDRRDAPSSSRRVRDRPAATHRGTSEIRRIGANRCEGRGAHHHLERQVVVARRLQRWYTAAFRVPAESFRGWCIPLIDSTRAARSNGAASSAGDPARRSCSTVDCSQSTQLKSGSTLQNCTPLLSQLPTAGWGVPALGATWTRARMAGMFPNRPEPSGAAAALETPFPMALAL